MGTPGGGSDAPYTVSPSAVPGNQRRASSTKGAAPSAVEARVRARSYALLGQVRVAARTVTVTVEPSPRRLLHADGAAVHAHELVDEREPDARALVAARPRPLDPVETLEEPRQFVLGDAGPGVGDLELRVLAVRPQRTPMSPSNVNLNAFETRLRTIFSHMSWST